jgi:hypothetical protein
MNDMNDLPGPLIPPRHELIDFHGDQLIALCLKMTEWRSRCGCSASGLALIRTLRPNDCAIMRCSPRDCGLSMSRIGGRVRSVMAIIHTKLPFWLATISPEQVNDETRPKLIQYQTELADMLARLFYGEPATPAPLSADPAIAALQQQFQAALSEMRRAREAIIEEQRRTNQSVADTQQHLTSLTEIVTELRTFLPVSPKQAEYVQRAIKRIATRLYKQRRSSNPDSRQTEDNLYPLLFGQFKVEMGIPRYDTLPIDKYDAAIAWIERKAAELLPDAPDAVAPRQETWL